jgi:hypothetical protein
MGGMRFLSERRKKFHFLARREKAEEEGRHPFIL